ncbi:MAG: type II secretion system major pseudopilin GspG [Verrucomicrobiales bacterium]
MKIKSSSSKRLSRLAQADAFTLLEIILVLGIIAVLLGAGIFVLRGNIEAAREQRAQQDIISLTSQLRTFEIRHGSLPTTEQGLKVLTHKPESIRNANRWQPLLERELRDPWDNAYLYRRPGVKNPQSFDLWSLGADGVESLDDIGNWSDD